MIQHAHEEDQVEGTEGLRRHFFHGAHDGFDLGFQDFVRQVKALFAIVKPVEMI